MSAPAVWLRLCGRLFGGGLLAQPESLELAGVGARQGRDELDSPRVLIRGDPLLDQILELADLGLVAGRASRQHYVSLHDLPARLIGYADDPALGDVGVGEQHLF